MSTTAVSWPAMARVRMQSLQHHPQTQTRVIQKHMSHTQSRRPHILQQNKNKLQNHRTIKAYTTACEQGHCPNRCRCKSIARLTELSRRPCALHLDCAESSARGQRSDSSVKQDVRAAWAPKRRRRSGISASNVRPRTSSSHQSGIAHKGGHG